MQCLLRYCIWFLILLPGAPGMAQPAPHTTTETEKTTKIKPLPSIRMDGNYFSRAGRRFIPVGLNWVPAQAGMEWPYEWDPVSIEKDFAQMRELGVNTVRLDLVWAWFEPRPGQYNEEAFKQLEFLGSLASRYGIYLHPELLIGGEVGEAYWDVPYRQGRHPHGDPEMLRLETDFVAELARRFGENSSIFAWDLTDEPPFWIAADSTTDAMAINWTRLIADAIRKYDKFHPLVVGVSTQDIEHGPFRPDNIRNEVDFLSVHPYTIYAPKLFPDSLLSMRSTFGAAFETELSGSVGKPVMIQELGASSAQYSPEHIAQYDEAMLYSSLGAGANGFLLWCYADAAPGQYSKVPYLRAPNETQFGLVTWDRRERPAAKMFREFSQIMAKLDLGGLEPAPAEAGIPVPQEWSKPRGDHSRFGLAGPNIVPYTSTTEGGTVNGQTLPSYADENQRLVGAWLSSYILARQAGLKAAFPREDAEWQNYRLLLVPAPLTSTETPLIHMHSDFWRKAEKYVQEGGALYASVSGDAAIPDMEQLFGARLADRIPVTEVILKVVAPFGNLKPGDTFHYTASPDTPANWAAILEPKGGEVIAVDQAGRPALIANHAGKGITLVCAYPLETYLASQPSSFERSEQTYRIYDALRLAANIHPLFTTDSPIIETAVLSGSNHGYLVAVNHSAEAQTVYLRTAQQLHKLIAIFADSERQVEAKDGAWPLTLGPFEGVILSWQ